MLRLDVPLAREQALLELLGELHHLALEVRDNLHRTVGKVSILRCLCEQGCVLLQLADVAPKLVQLLLDELGLLGDAAIKVAEQGLLAAISLQPVEVRCHKGQGLSNGAGRGVELNRAVLVPAVAPVGRGSAGMLLVWRRRC